MRTNTHRQRGVALLTVMLVLVLCVLITTANTRSGLLHEMIVGHQSDQLQAQTAAEALARDAEIDIRGLLPDGSPCHAARGSAHSTPPGVIGCRQRGTGALPLAPYFPRTLAEFHEARALVQVGAAVPCRDGICFPSDLHALLGLEQAPAPLQAAGAHYGQFTGAMPAPTPSANPLLAERPPRAWYWVEAFLYDTSGTPQTGVRLPLPDANRPFVYRITAVAHGMRPGTRAVVQQLVVPYPSVGSP